MTKTLRKLALIVAGVAAAVAAACTPPVTPEPEQPPPAPAMLLPEALGAGITVHLLHRGQGSTDESIVTRSGSRPISDPADATDQALLAQMDGHLDPATGRILVGDTDAWSTTAEVGVCAAIGSHDCSAFPGTGWAHAFNFSPDDTKVAIVTPYGPFGDSVDGRLQIFDVATRSEITRADDVIAVFGPPRWRPTSDAVAFSILRTTDNPYAGDLAVLRTATAATPAMLVVGSEHALVTHVLGWGTSGRLTFTTIDPEATFPGGTSLRSVAASGGPVRDLMTVESMYPGIALRDGSVLANQPGTVGLASVPHLVRDVEGSTPQPLSTPISWTEGVRTRWSNTLVLGAVAG